MRMGCLENKEKRHPFLRIDWKIQGSSNFFRTSVKTSQENMYYCAMLIFFTLSFGELCMIFKRFSVSFLL